MPEIKKRIDEATNPPNPKMHEWAKRRAVESITAGASLSTYTYACWHVVSTAHGGEFSALWRIFLGSVGRWLETKRAALEIWYERRFQGKTEEDFDEECEETARWIQDTHARGLGLKPGEQFRIKDAAKAEFGGVEGVTGFGFGAHTLRIYVRDAKVSKRLPAVYQGLPVECVITGEIKFT